MATSEDIAKDGEELMVQPPSSPAKELPARPVRLFSDGEDPCLRFLHVLSFDQVGILFKLCELLGSHGVDIISANVATEDGMVNYRFELQTSRPSDFADAPDWCEELEDFLRRNSGAALEGSLTHVSKKLSMNPDLLSVVSFEEIPTHDGPSNEMRYRLELEGINQAGLLTYASYVLFRSGFSIVYARISTVQGHVSDIFEISTTSPEAEHVLRSHLDVPAQRLRKDMPLPFHATSSDMDLYAMMGTGGPSSPLSGTPTALSPGDNRASFFLELDEVPEGSTRKDSPQPLPRSRLPSVVSDHEEPSTSGGLKTAAPTLPLEGSHASSSRSIVVEGGTLVDGAIATTQTSRRMSVHFANGDVYTGSCLLHDASEKRHGLGTYTYSPGTHETYRQYRGQWREDKKHGHGVLFFRNGGVYVGQWENNQKHGLGVLLDVEGPDPEPTAMPSYRYEGLWYEDLPHGLGVEESGHSAYFGQFARGKRHGRGVRMNLSKLGVAGCEVLDGNARLPLLEAMEAEMSLLGRFARSSSSSSTIWGELGHFQERNAATYSGPRTDNKAAPSLGSVAFTSLYHANDGNAWRNEEHNSGSSDSRMTSGNTQSPRSMQNMTPQDHSAVTPTLQYGRKRSSQMTTPDSSMPTPMGGPPERALSGNVSAGRAAGTGTCALAREIARAPPGQHPHTVPQRLGMPGPSPMSSTSSGSFSSSSGSGSGNATSGGVPAPPVVPAVPSPTVDRRGGLGQPTAGAGVVFSLREENDLLSPRETILESCPEDATQRLGLRRLSGASQGTISREASGATAEPGPLAAVLESSIAAAAVTSAGVVAMPAAAANLSLPVERSSQVENLRGTSQKDILPRRPISSPILWSEEELAAFMACLSINYENCGKVQKCKLKGVTRLLEMSNTEIRREFGLATPVERLVLRQSLKRLLDADRWENSLRGHRVRDILSDSVLSKHIIPLQALTLVAKISQGGYGTVFRGSLEMPNMQGARMVAVKEMKGERRVRLYELLKEACVMASLNHPNICQFLGVCADASARKHFIVSQLMDCSLFDLIHQPYKLRWHGELTVPLVINLSKGICAGIVYIHGRKLVHADLKSSNILIDYSSSWELKPRICDFGHAAVRSTPAPHHRCGTPHWAAPEVLRSEALGTAADIYSIGVIFWEMLTQKLPHKGLSFGQVLASVGWAGWTPDLSLLPEGPLELRRLIKQCLSFTSAERPDSRQLQQRLRRIPKQAKLKAITMLTHFLT